MRRTLLALSLAVVCCCTAAHAEEAAVSTLQRLLECAGAQSTEASVKALTALRQCADIPLPGGLLAILQAPGMVRAQGAFAYGYEGGRHSLRWYLADAAMQGKPEEVRLKVEGALPPDLHKIDGGRFVSSPTHCATAVKIGEMSPFIGGKTPTTGFRFEWTAFSMEKSLPVTLDGALRVLPSLKDERVPAEIYAALGPHEVAELAIGGTWTRYYDWTVALRTRDAAAAQALQTELATLIFTLGFKPSSTAGGEQEYNNAHGAYAWLRLEGTGVRLRIQPES